jgi:hypothetical protein
MSANERVGFMIVIKDPSTDAYSYGVPNVDQAPSSLYLSLGDAKRALQAMATRFDSFIPVAYGQAFPYEGTTFEQQLAANPFAMYGWGILENEDADDDEASNIRVGFGILKVHVQ